MQFSLIPFPPNLGGKILWAQGENFLPGFPLPLFSLHCQTVENSVFHSIFLFIFSIPLAKGLVAKLAPPHAQSAWRFRGERVQAVGLAACCNYLSKKKKNIFHPP